ncbi:MAG: asparagine synthase C-terminal domain-containing protein, partial [Acidimicrobiia bacterium]|nr:asparagine synthase C-terminal domain-containing protein [Acidimicrobiia bacterium]NNJ48707.1 asparagine synthase [Acidimicrobiia bacterium]
AIERLFEEFLGALEMQSQPNLKAGVLLGGFDSALVTAGLVRLGREVETFSFGYEDSTYDQPFVEALARYLNIKHHWVRVDKEQIRRGLVTFTDSFNRPTNWPNYVVSTAAACREMAAAGIEQAFSGDGCDSVFLGYPGTYQRARVVKQLSRLPSMLYQRLVSLLARPTLDRRLGHPYRVLLGLLRSQARTEAARTYLSLRILDEVSLSQLRRDGAPPDRVDVDDLANELAEAHSHLPRYRLAYAGKGAISPNKNKMIGSADVSGLTIWSPYMHESLKAFAASLPESMMRPEEKTDSAVTGKYILQRMAVDKGLLPRDIVYQPKVAAVDAPIDDWYASDLLPTLEDKWRSLPFDVDLEYARSLVKPKLSERLFRRYVMIDKVISHAASLLATYGAFAEASRDQP